MALNIKVYINIFLVILIFTIILSNIGIQINIGSQINHENFENDGYASDSSVVSTSSTSRKELEKYAEQLSGYDNKKRKVSGDKREVSDDKDNKREVSGDKDVREQFSGFDGFGSVGNGGAFPQMPVKPGNFFGVTENTANFSSNVMDINKFYSNSFGDIAFKTPYTGNAGQGQLSAKQVLDGAEYMNSGSDNSTATYKPDMWQYKDEMVMNGGNLYSGVSGFDDMDSGLAVYNGGAPIMSNTCTGGDMSGKCADDLRMGMGVPGRQQRETR